MTCTDENCPKHGKLKTRGNTFTVEITSVKPKDTVIGKREYTVKIPKYQRYERRKSKITIHKPKCIDLKEGDKAKITECKPISKTKHFTVIEKIGEGEK